jgi:hypothetical protein
MTASTAAKLHKLREQKMAQCLLLAEEGAEAAALEEAANAAEAGNVGAGLAPPTPADHSVAAGGADSTRSPQASVAPTEAQAANKNGGSPSANSGRGQSPLGDFHAGNRDERRRARALRRRENGRA